MIRVVMLMAFVLLVAPVALAQRDGTDGEYAQIARALGSRENCLIVRVSTVNRKWAAVKSSHAAGCGPADGILGMRRLAHGRWAVRYQGPVDPGARCRDVAPVPPRAGRDLRLCR